MNTLLKILDYIIRGPISILPKIYSPATKPLPISIGKTGIPGGIPSTGFGINKQLSTSQKGDLRIDLNSQYYRQADLLFRRLARQLSWYPKDMAEYVDLIYYARKSLGDSVDLNRLKAIALAANTLDQYKQGKISGDLVDDFIKQMNMSIDEVKNPSKEERIKEYCRQIKKLLDSGNIDKEKFYDEYSKLSTIIEYALMKYDNMDLDKIVSELAMSSSTPIEYRAKVFLLEEIINDLEKKDLIRINNPRNINLKLIDIPQNLPGWFIGRYVDPVKVNLKYYETIAKKYAHIVSIPKRKARLPLELSEHGQWKPWRDDISTLNIFESYIRGNGRFIWGVTTVKDLPIKFKSFYEDVSEEYRVGVSIDVSGSTGRLTGFLRDVIEYEIVLALAIYYFSIRNNIPVILHFWSDDDRIIEIRKRISGFPQKLVKTIEAISGGGTNPDLVYRVVKDEKYSNLFWIVFTDLDWPLTSAEKWLRFLRRQERKNRNVFFVIFYNEAYMGFEPTYPYICVYKKRLYKNDPICKLLKFIRENSMGELYIITTEYDKIVKTILRKIRETGSSKRLREAGSKR